MTGSATPTNVRMIENKTFDEIAVGDTASLSRRLTIEDIELFAVMSGDINPAHLDEQYAKASMFQRLIGHGMWGGALISTVLGTELPGPGTVYIGQDLRFRRPVGIDDTITVTVVAREKIAGKGRIIFDCRCTNQAGEDVITGTAEVLAPQEKIRRPRVELPDIQLRRHVWYRQLIRACEGLAPVRMGVVDPRDAEVLAHVGSAAQRGLIMPVLIGPEAQMRDAARAAGVDISSYPIVAVDSAYAVHRAIELARGGELQGILQGSLRLHDFLHHVVSPRSGLHAGRRMSHVFLADLPGHARPLMITDAGVNLHPTLEQKRDIIQNAIDFAHVLGIKQPKVALLSAVEAITSKVSSSIEAVALSRMAQLGQIAGGLVDGPLALDQAVSESAARNMLAPSPVAGKADILVVPDLEAGNFLSRQMAVLVGADAAGIVLGAKVPVIVATRTDNERSRLASCALAVLMVRGGVKQDSASGSLWQP
jgi:phosphotransacetylase/acyl dehydratase